MYNICDIAPPMHAYVYVNRQVTLHTIIYVYVIYAILYYLCYTCYTDFVTCRRCLY